MSGGHWRHGFRPLLKLFDIDNACQDATSHNFTINGYAFIPPSVPILLQILSGAQDAASLLPSGSIYSLPPNKTIEVSIPGGGNVIIHLKYPTSFAYNTW